MTILAIADEEAKALYDYYQPGRLDGVDIIIACGDMKRTYLEFLATMSHCPVLYVPGNHDDDYAENPPEGCECIDEKIYVHNGVRIAGLGGAYAYKPGQYMFTEQQMRWKILHLTPYIVRHGGFDILVTHAPARHVNDWDAPSHRGFECFTALLKRFQPRYFLHGHIHRNYGMNVPRKTRYGDTLVINAYEYYQFTYETENT